MNFGFNFRATLGFVTDPANTTFVDSNQNFSGGIYPQTVSGVTFGWISTQAHIDARDANSGVDARLAGCALALDTTDTDFRVDLPSTGSYNITIGITQQGTSRTNPFLTIFDNTTSLFTVSLSGTLATPHVLDANGTEHNSAALWVSNNTPKQGTFASTIFKCRIHNASGGDFTPLAHIFIADVPGAQVPYQPNYQRGPILAQ